MTSYQVRPAVVHDAIDIAQIHVNTWKAIYTGLMPDDYIASFTEEKRQKFWRDAITYGEPQVLELFYGDEPVGFAGYDRSRDKGTKSTVGEIWAFYVEPEHWDKGAGLTLWDATLEACVEEGFDTLTLWVFLGNERALRFFELAGFKRDMASLRTTPVGSIKLEEIRLKRPISAD